MIRELLIMSGILGSILSVNATTLSMTPSPVSVEQVGEIVTVSIEISDVADLHSAGLSILLPASVEPVSGSLKEGTLMESNGGNAVVYADIDGQRLRLSQALLGTGHDVDGGGTLGSFDLRILQVPSSPVTVSFDSVTFKNTVGTQLTNLSQEPLQIVSASVPTLTLYSNVTSIRSAGQQVTVKIHAENVCDLHSYALTMPYSASALTLVDTSEGSFLTSGGSQTAFIVDDNGSSVDISHAILGVGQDVSGSGTLASVTFEAQSLEDLPTTLTLTDIDMIDSFVVNWGPVVVAESLDILTQEEDSDGDGLPDEWEIAYFGAIDDPRAIPTGDIDGDGQNNFMEYVAGLDPLDPESRLYVHIQSLDNDTVAIQVWPIVDARAYKLEQSSTLSEMDEITPETSVVTNGVMTMTHTMGEASSSFYRVRVQLEP